MPFYKFVNVTESTAEVQVYGEIVTEKPWWADNEDGFAAQNDFIRDLKALGPKEEITVRINSFGGEVFAATAMATHLKENSAKIVAKIDGVSASAATIISSAADVTQMVSGGIFMVHDPMLFMFGSYNEQELQGVQNALVAVKKAIINGYKNKTGLSDDELSDIMLGDGTWMTAEEALEKGFIDEIIEDNSGDASISNDNKHVFYNSVDHDIAKFGFKNIPLEKFKNLAVRKPKDAGKPQDKPKVIDVEGGTKKMPLTLQELKNEHTSVYDEAKKEILAAERARMKGIDEISNTISPELVEEAKYTNYSQPQDLALAAIKAQALLGAQALTNMTEDLVPTNTETGEEDPKAGEGTVVDVTQAMPAAEPRKITAQEKHAAAANAAASKYERVRKEGK